MFSEIKICCFDLDGVLSDGIYQISEQGIVTKSFCTKDFYAIEQLMRNDIKVAIISQACDKVIINQVDRICSHSKFWEECVEKGYLIIRIAVKNKKKEVEKLFSLYNVSWDNIAYIGDAENDFECIKLARFSGCPTDAVPYIREEVTYPSDYYGGKGAVHDICMYILEMRNKKYE